MTIVDLTGNNFNETVARGIALVDFWAAWCGPCRAFAPVFEKAAREHADITFAKVDLATQPELAKLYEVQAVPTLMVFRDGFMVFRQTGAMQATEIKQLLSEVRSLDMGEVRRSAGR